MRFWRRSNSGRKISKLQARPCATIDSEEPFGTVELLPRRAAARGRAPNPWQTAFEALGPDARDVL